MGTYSVACRVENSVDRARRVAIPRVLVDTGSEYTWLPAVTLEKIGIARKKGFGIRDGQWPAYSPQCRLCHHPG